MSASVRQRLLPIAAPEPPAGASSASRNCSVGLLLFASALMAAGSAQAEEGTGERPFRVAFSAAFFGEVNRADALASVVAWQETILKQAGVPFDPDPLICEETPDLVSALERADVDAVALQFPEYASVPAGLLERDSVYVNQRRGGLTDQYVLLVRRDSGIEAVQALQGRHLLWWNHQRACLAPYWLDQLLAEREQKPATEFFGRRTRATKLAKVILPVFFRQADACIATRSGFQDISELNPQIGEQLQVLEISPELIPSFLCFRAGYSSRHRAQVETAIANLHASSIGKQVLTVFGCDRIIRQPSSCLGNSERLWGASLRLRSGEATSGPPRRQGREPKGPGS